MKASISLVIMLLSLSFMGCLEPEDKRTIIEVSDLEVTRLVVSEEELSQFPYTLDPIRNFSVVNPESMEILNQSYIIYRIDLLSHNSAGFPVEPQ